MCFCTADRQVWLGGSVLRIRHSVERGGGAEARVVVARFIRPGRRDPSTTLRTSLRARDYGDRMSYLRKQRRMSTPAEEKTVVSESRSRNPLRRLYQWVLHWAETRYGSPALFILAFAESSFFPIPPDVLLGALCVAKPRRSFRFALVCSVGSVLGGAFGYFLGMYFFDEFGRGIFEFYGVMDKYQQVAALYGKWNALAVAVAGFTPIPYKVFTIAGGACGINFFVFLLASALSRSARFFLVGAFFWYVGPSAKRWIDRYFNLLGVIFVVLLVGGFILIKYVMGKG